MPSSRLPGWAASALRTVVAPNVPLAFSRPGFELHALGFDPDDLAVDLSGRRCLVSGANTGLGYETALGLARLGAEVELLCRSADRGAEAVGRIRAAIDDPGRVRCQVLDVSSLRAIRELAPRLAERPVHVLVHNAGLLPDERTASEEGHEITWATHVLGPFLLTRLLEPALEAAEDARVIWVSSGGMYTQRLNLDDVEWTERPYDGVRAYAETKRAQVVLAELEARGLAPAGISVSSMHPGWAGTPGVRSSLPTFERMTRSVLRTPAQGADTCIWLAASPGARERAGRFFFDRAPVATHYLPFTRESEEDRRRLLERVERDVRAGAPAPAHGERPAEAPEAPGGHPPA